MTVPVAIEGRDAAGPEVLRDAGLLQLVAGHHRRPKVLNPDEWAHLEALARFHPGSQSISASRYCAVGFLFDPVVDVLDSLHSVGGLASEPNGSVANRPNGAVGCARWSRYLTHLARGMCHYHSTFWAWGQEEWAECVTSVDRHVGANCLAMVAYALAGHNVMGSVGCLWPYSNAVSLFGASVDRSIDRVWEPLHAWGYASKGYRYFRAALARVFLLQGSANLEVIKLHTVHEALANEPPSTRKYEHPICRALQHLGILTKTVPEPSHTRTPEALAGIAAPWVALVERWATTTTQRKRRALSSALLCIGRWAGRVHPAVTTPSLWTRPLAAEFVGAVDRCTTYEWASPTVRVRYPHRLGKPLTARAKVNYLKALRVFFRDIEEWGWEKIPFDYYRALATPSAIAHLIGPAPRVIDDAVWAKLLTAGLNLRLDDNSRSLKYYPEALIRAVALVWLFGGLRADEIRRLRVGCIRPQTGELQLVGVDATVPPHTVAFLDIPANKTTGPFSKPIDPVAATAILAWERVRPAQPPWLDRKTGEVVNPVFAFRGKPIGLYYLNHAVIRALCRQAGVPQSDARGSISSHRARSTIASQLGNAKEPMSPFELQAWLGHRDVKSTMSYLRPSSARQARAYADADYFRRNMRTVEVLIDQAAILSGAAANGQPWRYFDLGHGWCSYEFFEQCAHRMACARCPFYVPKNSTLEQLVEGKASLIRMRQEIPLTDDEVAAVDEGTALFDDLIARLRNVPTPTGPTPNELDRQRRAAGYGAPVPMPTAFNSMHRSEPPDSGREHPVRRPQIP